MIKLHQLAQILAIAHAANTVQHWAGAAAPAPALHRPQPRRTPALAQRSGPPSRAPGSLPRNRRVR